MVTTIEGQVVDPATGEVLGLIRADRSLVTGGDPEALALVPGPEQFRRAGEEFLPAPEVERIAEALIGRHRDLFSWAGETRISYFWKDKGGVSEGKAVLGKCVKLSGLAKKGIGGDFAIWLAADTARETQLTAWQMEASVFHELCHIGWDGEKGRPAIEYHEFEGFRAELRAYGAWQPDLQRLVSEVQQLPLFEDE